MVIEKANVLDAEDILEVQKLAFICEAEIYNNYTIYPLVETIEEIKREFKNKVIFKAIVNDEIVGAIRALLKNETCYIGKLSVHPSFQKQGIGTKLIKKVEETFKDISRFELFTGNKSERNILLYEKLGYRKFKIEKYSKESEFVYLEKCINS